MWNNHGICTERGHTPNQLFTSGVLHLRNSGLSAFDFFDNVPEVSEEGAATSDESGIQVPQNTVSLTDEQMEELQSTIDPLQDSSDIPLHKHTAITSKMEYVITLVVANWPEVTTSNE